MKSLTHSASEVLAIRWGCGTRSAYRFPSAFGIKDSIDLVVKLREAPSVSLMLLESETLEIPE
jgi:hypothetical protein